jgi:hypothetical protein
MSAYDLGRCACARHDWEEAARQLILSMDFLDELGDTAGAAQSRVCLARVRLAQQNLPAVADLLRMALQSYRALQQTDALWAVVEGAAALACARHHPENAGRLYAVASAQRDAVWDIIDPVEYVRRARDLAALRKILGAESCAAISAAAQALSLDEALELVSQELG